MMPPDLRRGVPLSFLYCGLGRRKRGRRYSRLGRLRPRTSCDSRRRGCTGRPRATQSVRVASARIFRRARFDCAGSALWILSHRCRDRTVESDSSKSDSDGHSSCFSGPASPNSPSYTPSPRNSSPSRPAGACPIVLEPFRGAELPRTVTLLPGESFPAVALGSQPALDGSDWLEMCLHTLTAALGEPCSVVIEARSHVPPAQTL